MTAARRQGGGLLAEGLHAAQLFNETWRLLELEGRSRSDDDRMIHTAHASRYHWGQVPGVTPAHLARGEWQISRVYAVLGRLEPALHHARRVLDLCQEVDPRPYGASVLTGGAAPLAGQLTDDSQPVGPVIMARVGPLPARVFYRDPHPRGMQLRADREPGWRGSRSLTGTGPRPCGRSWTKVFSGAASAGRAA